MPSVDTLDGELLKALLDESSLPRAVRGVANNLVGKLEEALSGARSPLFLFCFAQSVFLWTSSRTFSHPDRVGLGFFYSPSPFPSGFQVFPIALFAQKKTFRETPRCAHKPLNA